MDTIRRLERNPNSRRNAGMRCLRMSGRRKPTGIRGLWGRYVGGRHAKPLCDIHSAAEFHAIMVRERAAADRHHQQFSVVVFEAGDPEAYPDRARKLTDVLVGRIRLTDEPGWFDDRRIGVLLSYTSPAGARRLADDICRLLGADAGDSSFRYEVFTYPSQQHPTRQTRRVDQPPETSPDQDDRRSQPDVHAPASPADTTAFADSPVPALLVTGGNGQQHGHGPDSSAEEPAARCEAMAEPLEPVFVQPIPVWKRVIDVVGAIILLILSAPLLLVAALAVKLTSTGPVMFKQPRSGWRARPFTFYKFRSMYIGAEARKHELMAHNKRTGPVFKMDDDPRITPVGRIIRKWSIDELPQLVNVLKGDMSLVGPRPPTLDEVDQYKQWHDRRLEVTPGITCLWQVYAREDPSFERWIRLDLEYARRRSLLLDLQILLKTVPAVLSRKGAC